jgi:hypothetical protein
MLHHANKAADIIKALSIEEKEIDKFPRVYIANVMYTIIGDTFRQWVMRKCEERHAKIISTQDMAINMAPRSTRHSWPPTMYQVSSLSYSADFFHISIQGHLEQPDEVISQETTIKSPDGGGEEGYQEEGPGNPSQGC